MASPEQMAQEQAASQRVRSFIKTDWELVRLLGQPEDLTRLTVLHDGAETSLKTLIETGHGDVAREFLCGKFDEKPVDADPELESMIGALEAKHTDSHAAARANLKRELEGRTVPATQRTLPKRLSQTNSALLDEFVQANFSVFRLSWQDPYTLLDTLKVEHHGRTRKLATMIKLGRPEMASKCVEGVILGFRG